MSDIFEASLRNGAKKRNNYHRGSDLQIVQEITLKKLGAEKS